MSSNAVGSERVSRVVGYKLTKGNFSESSPNLPQRIVVIGEANTANQSGLSVAAEEITTAQKAGELYGYGSPMHRMFSILRPRGGGGTIGGIPTIGIAQVAAVGSAAKIHTITVTGTATKNTTHTLRICGRTSLDAVSYDVNIEKDDTQSEIARKVEDVINSVLGAPVTAAAPDESDPSNNVVTTTSKWTGLTANYIDISVDNNDDAAGVTYAVASTQDGSGTPSIAPAVTILEGNEWNTIVINSYGTVTAVVEALEALNGVPDPETPTGRFTGIIMKPFIALTGSTEDDPTSFTDADARKDQVTIAICPAPLSKGLPFEAAANMCTLFARVCQDTPHLDVSGKSYPDMPVPTDGSIGAMANYDNRDAFVKKGCSTVMLVAGKYQVQDFVTTYHPAGEEPPQFRYCRNLMLDFNVRYGYYLLEQLYVVDHAIVNDGDIVTVGKIVKPKTWRGVVSQYATDLSLRALIADPAFMQDSIDVNISSVNPDRLETFFRYKRSGYLRIASTTAQAGFNFGEA